MIHGANYLPGNYRFELEKTIRQIQRRASKRIALQFPEGLMHLSTIISDIIKGNTSVESVYILSDVVYGACCIDDISSFLIGCDLLIHYGHSCLFDVPKCLIGVLYVFVEVQIDIDHCIEMAVKHIDCTSLSVMGTIQYNGAVRRIRKRIEEKSSKNFLLSSSNPLNNNELSCKIKDTPVIPRIMPLSPGEVLGCTSPRVSTKNILFIAEGRFHLESAMIQNPGKKYFRYCPSERALIKEEHNYNGFLEIRKEKKKLARECSRYLVIYGTLGRQGGSFLLNRITNSIRETGAEYTTAYVSEIDEEFISSVPEKTAVIEIACPRIAIDWGSLFSVPIITPFEYFTLSADLKEYPMDYYSKEQKHPWQAAQ